MLAAVAWTAVAVQLVSFAYLKLVSVTARDVITPEHPFGRDEAEVAEMLSYYPPARLAVTGRIASTVVGLGCCAYVVASL